jgi:molybdenum cofactor cytidylyltransferase
MPIGIVILAAGASTRMGQPKQLLPYQGCSLVRRAATIAIASACKPVIVVVGANADRVVPELAQLDIAIVHNADWHQGMSTSLRIGITHLLTLNQDIQATVLMVCDQPHLSTAVLNQLVDTYLAPSHPVPKRDLKPDLKPLIVAAQYGNVIGVPALCDRALFPELMTLQGDKGARLLIQRYAAQTQVVSFPEGAIDIDTPTDYQHLSSQPQ